jgi:hypothetical protein
MITDSLIVEKSKQYDQEIISHLALDRCGLREMGGLERCTNLVQLNLSWNSLVMITDIECLVNLQHLDLSHNQIKRIEGLNTLNLLQFFDIKDNNITHLEHSISQLTTLKGLKTLYFAGPDGSEGNPICNNPQYTSLIIQGIPQLQILDGGHVGLIDASEALERHIASIKPDDSVVNMELPVKNWFTVDDLKVDDLENVKSDSSLNTVNKAVEETLEMLQEESGHLLRKASGVISKLK